MEKDITVRNYRDSDWPIVCAIHDAARQIELSAAQVSDAAFAPLQKCHMAEGFFSNRIILAECLESRTVKGFAAFRPRQLTWLYVSPDYFGEGIGQCLIRYVMDNTERPLDVQMLDGNKPAQRLYEFMGFKPFKRTKGKIHGKRPVNASGLTLRLNH
ncbi:N-acetyltransferase family protein [Maritalea sp. S77]|uniref:GNAT family N-acetyltransferase n=1 Tax=Maritalea sp. S77 TaxID=3415125 RepID=UPI003C7E7AFA